MKVILTFATVLGLAAATTVYGAQQTGPAQGNSDEVTAQERERSQDRVQVFTQEEHHTAAQDRDRARTPGSEASGMPQQDQDRMEQRDRTRTPGSTPGVPQQDQDTIQRRDRIHTPGTAQPGSRPRTTIPNSGSGGSRGGGGRRR